MHNKKLIATTLLLTATLAASLTACGNKTATKTSEPEVKTETTKSPVELDTEAATKKEEVTTEAVTEAPTEAVTEAQTEAVVEEVTEAPAEVPVEVVENAIKTNDEVVLTPAPAESDTQASADSSKTTIKNESNVTSDITLPNENCVATYEGDYIVYKNTKTGKEVKYKINSTISQESRQRTINNLLRDDPNKPQVEIDATGDTPIIKYNK